MEQHLTRIRHAKQFFIKCFFISLVIMVLVWILGTMMFNILANMNFSLYGLEPDDYAIVFVIGMCVWKLFIIQFTLVPFLATKALEKHIQKQMENC